MDHDRSADEPKSKQEYSSPTLVEYGSIGKLTQGGFGSGTDGGGTGMTMMCL